MVRTNNGKFERRAGLGQTCGFGRARAELDVAGDGAGPADWVASAPVRARAMAVDVPSPGVIGNIISNTDLLRASQDVHRDVCADWLVSVLIGSVTGQTPPLGRGDWRGYQKMPPPESAGSPKSFRVRVTYPLLVSQ